MAAGLAQVTLLRVKIVHRQRTYVQFKVAAEIRAIAQEQERWIKIASAFPLSPTSRNRGGINRTDWIPIDRAMYEACVDPRDYRPNRPNS